MSRSEDTKNQPHLITHHDEQEHKLHWNRIQHPLKPAADLSKFYVITIISNPRRFKRRYELYWDFKAMCESAGVKLITVEQSFGNRPFMVTRPDDPMNLQVNTLEELWHKENLINLGIKHARAIAGPGGVREVAWVDADCRPARLPKDWFEETWHMLQHHHFVQMWEEMLDVTPDYSAMGKSMPSFMANYIKYGTPNPEDFAKMQDASSAEYGGGAIFGRPGLAWAATIEAIDWVGGLIDFSILGAGDWYMAHALIGSIDHSIKHFAHTPYGQKLKEWEVKCERWIKRDVGFVKGLVYHDFHGKKVNRRYGDRGQILMRNSYDPTKDIKYDSQGLLALETYEPRQIQLRDGIRGYFAERNEDSIDIV